MKKTTIILLMILLLCCKGNHHEHTNKVVHDTSVIDIQDVPVIKDNDTALFKNIEYISLETNENCLIGHIAKVLYQNNRFYILDRFEAKAIFVFNRKGDFLYKIDRTGKGPGEYIELIDFDIDTEGNVYVYDNRTMKIIKYAANSDKFEDINVKYRFENFKMIENHQMFVYNVFNKGKVTAVLGRYGMNDKKLTTIIPARKLYDDVDIPRFNISLLFKSNDRLYFSPRFSNTVYQTNTEGVIETIKFNKRSIPSKEFIAEIKNNQGIVYETDEFITDIGNIYANNDFITMTVQKGLPYTFILSKNSGEKILYLMSYNKYYLGELIILGVAGDQFISYISPDKYVKDDWINKVKQSKLDHNVKSRMLRLKEQSNPVIVLFDIKDF